MWGETPHTPHVFARPPGICALARRERALRVDFGGRPPKPPLPFARPPTLLVRFPGYRLRLKTGMSSPLAHFLRLKESAGTRILAE